MAGYEYATATEPTPEDLEGIRETSLDYIESWYTADADRMRHCLHPDLAKHGLVRQVIDTRTERIALSPTTAHALVEMTAAGVGRTEPADRFVDVEILAATHHLASTRVVSMHMIDMLQLMKFPEGWKIVHSIWGLKGGVIANETTDV